MTKLTTMSFASIVKIVFSWLIVSVLVAYAFSQNSNKSARNQRETLRTPLRRPTIDSMQTRDSGVNFPNIAPAYGDSIVKRKSVSDTSENSDFPQYFRTPSPTITPPFSHARPVGDSMPKEKLPELTPGSMPIQIPKVQTPSNSLAFISPITRSYSEVAPDSNTIPDRIEKKETSPLETRKVLQRESFPSTIPKTAYVPDEEKTPQGIEDVVSPHYKVEQIPEYAPFTDPLITKREEDTPEIPPSEIGFLNTEVGSKKEDEPEIPPSESVSVSAEKEIEEEKITLEQTWSIAAVEDKHPPQDERREKSIATDAVQSETVSTQTPRTVTKKTVNVKTALANGAFIQLASYTKQDDATHAATSPKFTTKNNIFVYKKLSSQYYKLVVGPFNKDDVGVQLLSFNRKGFSDAFVLTKH